VAIGQLAQATGLAEEEISDALRDRATQDEQSAVVELFGIQLSQTSHRITIGDATLYTCCALVAHMLAHLFNTEISIESKDPESGEAVVIKAGPEGVHSLVPDSAKAILIETQGGLQGADIASLFCNHVNHFVSKDSAEQFASRDKRRFVLSIEDLHAAGRGLYEQIWS